MHFQIQFSRIMSSSTAMCLSRLLIASAVILLSINESQGDEDFNRMLVAEPEQILGDETTASASQHNSQQEMNEEKRNWQSLQGSWGKRNDRIGTGNSVDFGRPYGGNFDDSEYEMSALMGYDPVSVMESSIDYGEDYSKLGNLLRATAAANALRQLEQIRNRQQSPIIYSDNDQQKRGWKSMGNAWGKRLGNGNDWNRFRGSWGKREPGWNNLKGLWGKRSNNPNNWNKLQSAWGKRDF